MAKFSLIGLSIVSLWFVSCLSYGADGYQIGVGRADCTGPPNQIIFVSFVLYSVINRRINEFYEIYGLEMIFHHRASINFMILTHHHESVFFFFFSFFKIISL